MSIAVRTAPSNPYERRRVEILALTVRMLVVAFWVVGAYGGLFDLAPHARDLSVGLIAGYHAIYLAYVLQYRLPGRPLAWVGYLTPFLDMTCISAAWLALGDPDSVVWVLYIYGLVGYVARMHGHLYNSMAALSILHAVAVRLYLGLHNGDPDAWSGAAISLVVMTALAALTSGLASAFRAAELQARQLAAVDGLTGIPNRRTFYEHLEGIPPGRAFALLMVDLDDFKRLNDSRGHIEGDAVIAAAASVLTSALRPGDLACRYGGEEFVVLLPGAGATEATAIAGRIRQAIARATPVTASVGGASRRPGEPPAEVLRRADDELLRAKATGKDAVSFTPGLRAA